MGTYHEWVEGRGGGVVGGGKGRKGFKTAHFLLVLAGWTTTGSILEQSNKASNW